MSHAQDIRENIIHKIHLSHKTTLYFALLIIIIVVALSLIHTHRHQTPTQWQRCTLPRSVALCVPETLETSFLVLAASSTYTQNHELEIGIGD